MAQENNKSDPPYKFANKYFYEQLEDFYGKDNIPDDLTTLFENGTLYNYGYGYINETLKTYDYKELQNQLLKEYGDYIVEDFKNYKGADNIKSFYTILILDDKTANLDHDNFDVPLLSIKGAANKRKEAEKFFNILRFFNYQCTYWKLIDWKKVDNKYALFIEPIYAEDATEYFNRCHRQAYYFTYKENVEKILENGIRLKRGAYREFPERIYLWAADKKLNIEHNDVISFIRKIFGDSTLTLNDIGIIKVDLYNTDFPAYKDTAVKNKEAVFVYNSIPARLCKEIKM